MKTLFAVIIVILTFSIAGFAQSISTGCEPSAETRKLLDLLRTPADAKLSANEVKEKRLSLLRSALQTSPRDVFLHKKYQEVVLGPFGIGRPDAIKEYEALLKQHPDDPLYLYLAANAQFTHNTKQSVDYLRRAIQKDHQFGWPYLLLAEIQESKTFENPAELRANLAEFQKLCPDSPAMFLSLRWNTDKELIASTAEHLRKNLANRTDTDGVTAHITLWYFGLADERPEKQSALVEQIKQDVTELRQKEFPRNAEWLRAMQYAADAVNDRKIYESALEEASLVFPDSALPANAAIYKWRNEHPVPPQTASDDVNSAYNKLRFEKMREFSDRWPAQFGTAISLWDAMLYFDNASAEDIGITLDRLIAAMAKYPDSMRTSPPYQADISETLLKRNARIKDIPAIIATGLQEGDKMAGEQTESDLYPTSRQGAESQRTYWHLFAYFPLTEAYLRMNQLDKVQETLINIEENLSIIRPPEKASTEDKFRFGEIEARYWHEKGQLAEKQGHKLDALVSYRNALVAFPPRRPRGDSRDLVMADARRIWKEMGGTDQGWTDWAMHSSLNNFSAGAQGANAWKQIAQSKPGLVLTDSQGKEWKPNDLKDKTVFVNYWATWCGPCRSELPYLQKLYERFKDRQDVVILSLNVDDDPKVMTPMLKQMGLSLPSIAARDFGYQLLPVMALPSNWIVSAKGNVMFLSDESMDKWVDAAAAALEKAAKK